MLAVACEVGSRFVQTSQRCDVLDQLIQKIHLKAAHSVSDQVRQCACARFWFPDT